MTIDSDSIPQQGPEQERVTRNLGEILQELRVALPGVQVLFAFLLAVPLQTRFGQINAFEKDVYFATLLCTAASAALMITPTAYHRVTFRLQQKEHLVKVANRCSIAGLIFLVLAMCGALLLVTDILFGTLAAALTAAGAALMFVILWGVIPSSRCAAGRRRSVSGPGGPDLPQGIFELRDQAGVGLAVLKHFQVSVPQINADLECDRVDLVRIQI